jgi:hypothetical protein
MAAKSIELTLKDFRFPPTLPNNKANFRFVVDLRYIKSGGELATENAVMPSLDTFWECDTGRENKPNYVRRKKDVKVNGVGYATFNMAEIDAWDRLIVRFKGESAHSIQFKVFDVDRKGFWEKIKGVVGPIVQALLGRAKKVIPGIPQLPEVSEAFGSAVDDVQSWIVKKLAAGGDDVLYRGSVALGSDGEHTIEGKGTGGKYQIVITQGTV